LFNFFCSLGAGSNRQRSINIHNTTAVYKYNEIKVFNFWNLFFQRPGFNVEGNFFWIGLLFLLCQSFHILVQGLQRLFILLLKKEPFQHHFKSLGKNQCDESGSDPIGISWSVPDPYPFQPKSKDTFFQKITIKEQSKILKMMTPMSLTERYHKTT